MCYEMTPRYLCSDIFKIVLIFKIGLQFKNLEMSVIVKL